MPAVPQRVIDEVLSGVTRVTRRVEIYYPDAKTLWEPADVVRLVDGSVSVDYTRDERRAMDGFVLSNSDGALKSHVNGFWYDKIIKAYAGVEYGEYEDYGDAIVQDSPRLYWRFGDAPVQPSDFSNSGHAGVYVGSAPDITNGPTPLAYTPDLRGSVSLRNAYVKDAGVTDTILYRAHYNVSMEGWFFLRNYNTVAASNTEQYFVRFLYHGLRIGIRKVGADYLIVATMWNGADVAFDIQSTVSMNLTTWYHIGFTYDGVTARLFINGDLAGSVSVAGPMHYDASKGATGNALWVGNYDSAPTPTIIDGLIDEVAFYAYTLDPSQIKSHYLFAENPPRTSIGFEMQIGEFMIDSIAEDSSGPKTVTINGRDYTKKLLNDKYDVAVTFSKGSNIGAVIRGQLIAAGIDPKRILIPATSEVLASNYSYDPDTPRWDIVKGIANAFNYEVYFDRTGTFIMRTFRDPIKSAITWTLQTGPKVGNLVRYGKSTTDAGIYNHIVVRGESSDSSIPPVYARAINSNPASPTNINAIGRRTLPYSSALITTTAQAQALANSYLKIYAQEDFTVDFDAIVAFWAEAGDIVRFIDPDPAPGDPSNYLLSNFAIPMGSGTMSGSAKRVTIVG
jgi:hypothetical protein